MAETVGDTAESEKGMLSRGAKRLIWIGGLLVMFAAVILFQAFTAAKPDGPAPTDAKNVQTIVIDGRQVLVFDVNHDGTDLICTQTRGDTTTSCVKR